MRQILSPIFSLGVARPHLLDLIIPSSQDLPSSTTLQSYEGGRREPNNIPKKLLSWNIIPTFPDFVESIIQPLQPKPHSHT